MEAKIRVSTEGMRAHKPRTTGIHQKVKERRRRWIFLIRAAKRNQVYPLYLNSAVSF